MTEPIIHVEGLSKRFGDFTAVDHLTIRVEPGTIFAFLGANGSGKSTTIRMLIGLLQPTAGTITVDGVDVIRDPRRVRDRIGYMGQKVSLYQGLTLRENVAFYAGLFGLSGPTLEQRWGELRERFALAEAERDKTQDLPAGLRQRAGLALSTLHRPRVLFLDEPTAGVDVHHRGLFWELIQDEAAAGVTVFVTTHFLEEVEYCDWVAFIDAGRLIADAAPETLRRQHAQGYRVAVELPPGRYDTAVSRLSRFDPTPDTTGHGVVVRVAEIDAALLTALDDVTAAVPESRVHIDQPTMTAVFRQVLETSGRGA